MFYYIFLVQEIQNGCFCNGLFIYFNNCFVEEEEFFGEFVDIYFNEFIFNRD